MEIKDKVGENAVDFTEICVVPSHDGGLTVR